MTEERTVECEGVGCSGVAGRTDSGRREEDRSEQDIVYKGKGAIMQKQKWEGWVLARRVEETDLIEPIALWRSETILREGRPLTAHPPGQEPGDQKSDTCELYF